MFTILKAYHYACSAYPKLAAPHRFSPHEDYDVCMLTAYAALEEVSYLGERLEELRRGSRTLAELGLGEAMSRAVQRALREVGHGLDIGIALSSPIATVLAYGTVRGMSFGDALNIVKRALVLSKPEDAVHLVKVLRLLGGEYAWFLEQCDLSERSVEVSGLSLRNVLERLSSVSKLFKPFVDLDRVLEVASFIKKDLDRGEGLNFAIVRSFLALAKSMEGLEVEIPQKFSSSIVLNLLRLDGELRKKGVDLRYLVPYLVLGLVEIVTRV